MKTFKKLYIEITNVCNLACSFCPKTIRKPQFMSIETFSKILDEAKGHTKYIYLHVKGEPLLHPQLEQLLDISHEKGYMVNITTNGTLIGERGDMLIKKQALRKISFSLHSFDGNNDNDDNSDGNNYMEKYLLNIVNFAKKAVNNTEMFLELRLWNLEQDNVVNLEKHKNKHMLSILEEALQLPFEIKEEVQRGHGKKIWGRISMSQSHEFKWPDIKLVQQNAKGFCYGLRSQVAILVDGTVVPCCLDGEGIIKLGNINDSHFTQIVEGQRAKAIVDGFSRREAVEELCRKCGFRERFDK